MSETEQDNESIDQMELLDIFNDQIDDLCDEIKQKNEIIYTFENKINNFEKLKKEDDEYFQKILSEKLQLKKDLDYLRNEKSKYSGIDKKGVSLTRQNIKNRVNEVNKPIPEDKKIALTKHDNLIFDEMRHKRIMQMMTSDSGDDEYYKKLGQRIRNMSPQELKELAADAEHQKKPR